MPSRARAWSSPCAMTPISWSCPAASSRTSGCSSGRARGWRPRGCTCSSPSGFRRTTAASPTARRRSRRRRCGRPAAMASWAEVEAQAPELAALARSLFNGFTHKTLATLRRDGSPRISGTEVEFEDGGAWIGSMWRAVKALDLQRDPRFAIHSGSPDPPGWRGDAKIAGTVEDVTGPGAESHRFRLDISELVGVRLGDPADHLVIDAWHEGHGLTSRRR